MFVRACVRACECACVFSACVPRCTRVPLLHACCAVAAFLLCRCCCAGAAVSLGARTWSKSRARCAHGVRGVQSVHVAYTCGSYVVCAACGGGVRRWHAHGVHVLCACARVLACECACECACVCVFRYLRSAPGSTWPRMRSHACAVHVLCMCRACVRVCLRASVRMSVMRVCAPSIEVCAWPKSGPWRRRPSCAAPYSCRHKATLGASN